MSLYDDYPEIEATILKLKPDFVCTTAFTASINDALKVLNLAKSLDANVTTVLGGVHPTFCYEEIFQGEQNTVDYCVLGEVEETLPELLNTCITGKGKEQVQGIAYLEDGKVIGLFILGQSNIELVVFELRLRIQFPNFFQ